MEFVFSGPNRFANFNIPARRLKDCLFMPVYLEVDV